MHMLVVVLLSLVDLLVKSNAVVEETLELGKRDGLEQHTSELTPKSLISEHTHDASVDLLTDLLLVERLGLRSGLGLTGNGLGLRLLDGHGRLLHGTLLHLGLTLLLVAGTAPLTLTAVERTRIGRGTREHGLTHEGIHVGGHGHDVHVGIDRLTVHATHGLVEGTRVLVLRLKHGVTLFLLHGVSNIERLAVEDLKVNLLDSIVGVLRSGKVAETKAPADAALVPHHDDALDLTVSLEEVAEIIISDIISKVADVQIGLGSRLLVVKGALVPLSGLTLALLLGAVDVELEDLDAVLLELLLVLTLSKRANEGLVLPLEGLLVKSLLGLDSVFVLLKVDEAEALALTVVLHHDDGGGDLAENLEHLDEVVLGELLADVLHVEVGEDLVGVVGTLTLGDELLNDELLTKALEVVLVVLASLESLDRVLRLLKLHETVAEADTVFPGLNLARSNGTKVGEDILQLDQLHAGLETLDEQVALVALALRGVTARPHDTAGLTLKLLTVEGIESLLSVLGVLEVDVGIAKRTLILHITADTDGKDGTAFLESVINVRLTNILTKVTDIQGAVGIGGGGNSNRLLGRH